MVICCFVFNAPVLLIFYYFKPNLVPCLNTPSFPSTSSTQTCSNLLISLPFLSSSGGGPFKSERDQRFFRGCTARSTHTRCNDGDFSARGLREPCIDLPSPFLGLHASPLRFVSLESLYSCLIRLQPLENLVMTGAILVQPPGCVFKLHCS